MGGCRLVIRKDRKLRRAGINVGRLGGLVVAWKGPSFASSGDMHVGNTDKT